jgi:hypothetical protein
MPAATRDPENANLKPGAPPQARTGSKGANSAKTRTNPSSGETQRAGSAKNKSAAEDRSPSPHKDRRVKPQN